MGVCLLVVGLLVKMWFGFRLAAVIGRMQRSFLHWESAAEARGRCLGRGVCVHVLGAAGGCPCGVCGSLWSLRVVLMVFWVRRAMLRGVTVGCCACFVMVYPALLDALAWR